MINFREIGSWERFEDFCEELLNAERLRTRRLGRGPGQIGKDIIAKEKIEGLISDEEIRTWLVECKYTDDKNSSISERDVFNVMDRVLAQRANGYMLFTNARLTVNLEKTLYGLKKSGKIGIAIWTAKNIEKTVLYYSNIFRKFFPESFKKFLKENRLIYLNQISRYRSPLVHIMNSIQFIQFAPNNCINDDHCMNIFNNLIDILKKMVIDLDDELSIIIGE
jgi:hypothetical protein